MQRNKARFASIDEYIATFPENIQKILEQMRATIQAAAPEAQETITYQMPTFTLHGRLVYFAAAKRHIGFYPLPSGIEAFRAELSRYGTSVGAIRFPVAEPLPLALITDIVKFRVAENLKKAAEKSGKESK